MIVTKTRKEMQECEVVESTKYYCDKCGEEIIRDDYSRTSNKIKFQTGYALPEGGSIEGRIAYLCEDCAIEIEKMLVAAGVKFTEFERDW